jgi:hypothetical protein
MTSHIEVWDWVCAQRPGRPRAIFHQARFIDGVHITTNCGLEMVQTQVTGVRHLEPVVGICTRCAHSVP